MTIFLVNVRKTVVLLSKLPPLMRFLSEHDAKAFPPLIKLKATQNRV